MKLFTMRRNCCVRLAKESISVIWDKYIIIQVISQYASSWNYLWIQTLAEVLIINLPLISLLHRRSSFLKLPSEFVKPSTKPQYSTSKAFSVEDMCKRDIFFFRKSLKVWRDFCYAFILMNIFPSSAEWVLLKHVAISKLCLKKTNQERKERRWTPWIWLHLGGCRHGS